MKSSELLLIKIKDIFTFLHKTHFLSVFIVISIIVLVIGSFLIPNLFKTSTPLNISEEMLKQFEELNSIQVSLMELDSHIKIQQDLLQKIYSDTQRLEKKQENSKMALEESMLNPEKYQNFLNNQEIQNNQTNSFFIGFGSSAIVAIISGLISMGFRRKRKNIL